MAPADASRATAASPSPSALNDDALCVAMLFCATFGVGSMSFGAIFAATGPVLASLAIYFLSACNLHAR